MDIFTEPPTRQQFDCIVNLNEHLANKWLKQFKKNFMLNDTALQEIHDVIQIIGKNQFFSYLRRYDRNLEIYVSEVI